MDSREEMIAEGFADLQGQSVLVSLATMRIIRGVRCGAARYEMQDATRTGGSVLLDDLELLHQNGDELLDYVGAVARTLELDDDGLDDLVVDFAQVDLCGGLVGGVLHLDGGCSGSWRGRGQLICGGLMALGGGRVVAGVGAFYLLGGMGLSVHVGGAGGAPWGVEGGRVRHR